MDKIFPLDKATLDKICQEAKTVYLERGNKEGPSYLTADEMVARAYVEAIRGVLNRMGYQIVRVSKD